MDNVLPDNLDNGISAVVIFLNRHGIKTFESCEGGDGHAFAEPTVRFFGDEFDLCELNGFLVSEAHRVYRKAPYYDETDLNNIKQGVGLIYDKPFNELVFLRLA